LLHHQIREFEITDEIRKLGFSRIYAIGKTLVLKSTTTNSVIHCPFHKGDILKTVTRIEKSLTGYPTRFDKETITKLCAPSYASMACVS
jgi:hypothetical protein